MAMGPGPAQSSQCPEAVIDQCAYDVYHSAARPASATRATRNLTRQARHIHGIQTVPEPVLIDEKRGITHLLVGEHYLTRHFPELTRDDVVTQNGRRRRYPLNQQTTTVRHQTHLLKAEESLFFAPRPQPHSEAILSLPGLVQARTNRS